MSEGCYISTAAKEKSIRGEKIAHALTLDHFGCSSKSRRYTLFPLKIFFYLLFSGYDYIIVNNIPAHLVFWCWLASKIRHFIIVVDFVNLWEFAIQSKYPILKDLVKRYENWMYKRITCGISINRFLSKIVENRWHFPVQEIYDAADDTVFTPASPAANRIISVANLRKDEGIDILLESLSILKKRKAYFNCWIIGDGDEKRNLESLSKALNLKDSVEFLGWLSFIQIPDYYRKASIGVIPIRHTSPVALPIKLFEMLSSGLAVVASDTPAIRSVISHKKNGLLFHPEDKDDLARQLETVLRKHRLRGSLQRNARITVVKSLNWKNQVIRLREFICRLDNQGETRR
ncbi:glycosyltransferase family 4 protein [[Eubacterium] cellulosolvens]